MSASPLTSTLRYVTGRKLERLALECKRFDQQKQELLRAVEGLSPLEKVKTLLAGHEKNKFTGEMPDLTLADLKKLLPLAEYEGTVSEGQLRTWATWFESNLEAQSVRYKYTDLFGRLVMQLIENSDGNETTTAYPDDDVTSTTSEPPLAVGREEMHKQRQMMEDLWFSEPDIDDAKIHEYLDNLFVPVGDSKSRKLRSPPIENMRTSIGGFTEIGPISQEDVKAAIESVIVSDFFTGSKRQALVELSNQEEVVKEIHDVLLMELKSLPTWKWEKPVAVDLRRQLNMKYRAYLDEEIHDAILFQLVGGHLATVLRRAFVAHFHSDAWLQSPYRVMNKNDSLRRQYYLGTSKASGATDGSVRSVRREEYLENYFLTQLPAGPHERREYSAEDASNDDYQNPLPIKEMLLRLVTLEMQLNLELYGEFTALQTDFKWFGPSLPHKTIITVLSYFGVNEKWLDFIKKFLNTPLVFNQDGPNAEVRERRRGAPISHTLTEVFGESILFCLDFAVNQRTGGALLYRLHDDVWFMGQESSCVTAWETIKDFTRVMGLTLNEEKTAVAKIYSKDTPESSRQPLDSRLPSGEAIRWGFLILDEQTGSWSIDKDIIAKHIKELRLQLGACNSCIAWVRVWNSYVARFLTVNFGQPACCLGRSHIEGVIKAFEYIQEQIFEGDTGQPKSALEYLKRRLKSDFGAVEVPDGYVFWPHEFGGLELRNPFIPLQGMLETVRRQTSTDHLKKALDMDESRWEQLQDEWERGMRPADQYVNLPSDLERDVKQNDTFMTFEEYSRFSEQTSSTLKLAYQKLQQPARMEGMDQPKLLQNGSSTNTTISETKYSDSWAVMDSYWQWVFGLYSTEMVGKFGKLTIGEPVMLPIGLLETLKSERVRWQG